MDDGQDLDYEAGVHLDTPMTEGFYPEWDGPLLTDEDIDKLDDEAAERRFQAELDACDIGKIFDALTDAGIM